jgi:hypothetical protein
VLGSIAWAGTETIETATLSIETLKMEDTDCISDFATTTSLYGDLIASGREAKNRDWTLQNVGIPPLLFQSRDPPSSLGFEPLGVCNSSFVSRNTSIQCRYRADVTCLSDFVVNLRAEFEVSLEISSDALNDIEYAKDAVLGRGKAPSTSEMSNAARNGTGVVWGVGLTGFVRQGPFGTPAGTLSLYPNGTINTPKFDVNLGVAYTYWPDWVTGPRATAGSRQFESDPLLRAKLSIKGRAISVLSGPLSNCDMSFSLKVPAAYYTLPNAQRQQMSTASQSKFKVPCVRSQQVEVGPGFSGGLAVFLTVIGLITF